MNRRFGARFRHGICDDTGINASGPSVDRISRRPLIPLWRFDRGGIQSTTRCGQRKRDRKIGDLLDERFFERYCPPVVEHGPSRRGPRLVAIRAVCRKRRGASAAAVCRPSAGIEGSVRHRRKGIRVVASDVPAASRNSLPSPPICRRGKSVRRRSRGPVENGSAAPQFVAHDVPRAGRNPP